MKQTIRHTTYKQLEAVTLDNDTLVAQFLPGYGGKMVSFIHKATRREFLVQALDPEYKKLDYDGDYVAAECSGFDDLFPTIDKVHYPDSPWKGVEIPDHGEVCGLKWEYEIRPDCLYMTVNGVRFPYQLEKWISFQPDGSLNIAYKATNLSTYDMDFIWAAHPMINSESGGVILLPYEGEQETRAMFSTQSKLGNYADIVLWPEAACVDGSTIVMDRIENNPQLLQTYNIILKKKYRRAGVLIVISQTVWCSSCLFLRMRCLTWVYGLMKAGLKITAISLWRCAQARSIDRTWPENSGKTVFCQQKEFTAGF